jgi:ribosomal protein S18 acetylase RimI-like enzyme
LTRIRQAGPEDSALLHRLLTAMAAEQGESIASTPESLRLHGFGATPRFHSLIAETDQPLGLVLYFPEYSTWRGQLGLFVQDLYVSPVARGLGLGRNLLAAALAQADWQPQFLSLMVAHNNVFARNFYQSLGLCLRDKADQLILSGEPLVALRGR